MNRREFLKGAAVMGMGATAWGCALRRGLEDPRVGKAWDGWRPGHFQIHVIYTGVAESLFLVFPDGTTMLLDCGDHPACKRGKLAVPILPDQSRHAGEWVARYVLRANPHGRDVDYMMLSHYHSDHGGQLKFNAGDAPNGKYKLSGFGQAMEYLTFRRAIDRAWCRCARCTANSSAAARRSSASASRRAATRSVRCAATRRTSASCRSARTGASCTPTATSRT